MMLIFIVVVFIICHCIRSIINTYECIQLAIYGQLKHWPDWIQTLVHVNHFALVVNSSINILIYCCLSSKFREEGLTVLRNMVAYVTCGRFCSGIPSPGLKSRNTRTMQQTQLWIHNREQIIWREEQMKRFYTWMWKYLMY